MAILGWTRTESPFHAGELAIQARMGAQEHMDKQGRRVIREFLPDQHRQFFAQLPYLIVGTVDAQGNPWASILVGKPAFCDREKFSRGNMGMLFGEGEPQSSCLGRYPGFDHPDSSQRHAIAKKIKL